jgi:hypothetical protein
VFSPALPRAGMGRPVLNSLEQVFRLALPRGKDSPGLCSAVFRPALARGVDGGQAAVGPGS